MRFSLIEPIFPQRIDTFLERSAQPPINNTPKLNQILNLRAVSWQNQYENMSQKNAYLQQKSIFENVLKIINRVYVNFGWNN